MHVQHVQPHRAGFDLPSLAVRRRYRFFHRNTKKFISLRHENQFQKHARFVFFLPSTVSAA